MTATSGGFRREIASLDEVFEMMEAYLADRDVDDRAAFRLALVVEELFTNLVKYNPKGDDEIGIHLEPLDGRVRVELVDRDADPFDPADVPDAPVAAGIRDRRPGGLGLHLVRSLVDDLVYEYDEERRRMRISFTMTLEH